MRNLIQSVLILFLISVSSVAQTLIYVSPTGNDSNPGTIDQPLATITKAYSLAAAGDTIFVRGGRYICSSTISISKSGTDSSRYYLWAYPGERPILDFSSMAVNSSNRGVKLSGSYWYAKGFEIYKAGDNGMIINGGSHNVIEFCSFIANSDAGLQLGSGASYNQIINCDSYYNRDPGEGNADGFAPKLDVGTGNYFYGCRSWQNSDDGFDGYMRVAAGADTVTTTLENCWSFMNGYLIDGTMGVGNGNGFKTGGSDNKILRHNVVLKNCFSFDNKAKGFDQNHNRGSITFLNCTAYNNGNGSSSSGDQYNFSVPETLSISAGKVLTVENCISLGSHGGVTLLNAVQATNSWMNPPFSSPTSADFVSVDTTGVRGPRKPDGSLPDITFMHLAAGSDLINAGTDVGLPYDGPAPDLGCFETTAVTAVPNEPALSTSTSLLLHQNYPNPFNPSTVISYQLPVNSYVTLRIYDVLGRETKILVDENELAGQHRVTFDGSGLASGIYYYRLTAGNLVQTKKLVLIK